MRIAYVARHGVHGNCDERAVGLALEELGHEVVRLSESEGDKVNGLTPELVLFHKWKPPHELLRSIRAPKVFWYWDLIAWYKDGSLSSRNRHRETWMRDIVPFVDAGFLTDGDFIERKGSRNLYWLPQGADGTFVDGLDYPADTTKKHDVLLTGISKGGGRDRESFVEEMSYAYGRGFRHVRHGLHREGLYRAIQESKIVVAPDSPMTDKYWSNRIYLTLGMGGFLLHPYTKGVAEQYQDGRDVVLYRSRTDLHQTISHYLYNPHDRISIATQGMKTTKDKHTYKHRLVEMLEILKTRRVL